jgi:hypothetical protein
MGPGAALFQLRPKGALDALVRAIDLPIHWGSFANRIEQ